MGLLDKQILLDVLVVPDLPQTLILGVDFWTRMGIVPDLRSQSWKFNIDSLEISTSFTLDEDQRDRLNKIVSSYFQSFSSKLGYTMVVEHEIKTTSPPIKQRNYPVSPKVEEHIHAELDRLLEEGIVEPSSSGWSSPVVMIPKKDGSYRFCIDYRRLNKVTEKDAYPLPRISAILDKLRHAKYLSSLDIRSAYWQVPVAEKSRPYTAFSVSGRGLFQWCRMPFGLTNAPATFQRLIETVLGHDLEPYVFPYLDDIIIATPTFELHLDTLVKSFDRLEKAGLILNQEKCHFVLPRLKYLGYIVDNGGIHVDPDKVSAIVNISVPSTVREVRQFLGMASWYRRFVPEFASVVAPLTSLLRKNQKFIWTEEQNLAFVRLKELLIRAPILYCPDFNRAFTVQTDASAVGLGAVLTQAYPDGEHVISFISRSLSPAERNYSTTERECLAVIWAIEKFRCYLEGYHFQVLTDHYSLLWLQRLQNPSGKLCRWMLRLQAFDFDIVHRKGKDNVVPDALSRTVPIVALTDYVQNAPTGGIGDDGILLVTTEVKDRWYSKMLRSVELNPCKYAQWRIDGLQLYKYPHQNVPDSPDITTWKRVVPKDFRLGLLQVNHNDPLAGHLGVYKTYHRLREIYYWPQMRGDVAKYIRGCQICQAVKPEQLAPKGLMANNPVADRPWKIVSTDLIGPLPRSSKGHTHILVVYDCFSKFCRAFPLRKATSKNVAQLWEDEIILLFGAPQLLLADNGAQYVGKEFIAVAKRYGVKIRYNPVYHPQSNPTERMNRTFKAMIVSFVEDNHRQWDSHLTKLASAFCSSKSQVTGFTPHKLVFGREFVRSGRLFVNLKSTENVEFGRRTDTDNGRLEETYRLVQRCLEKAQNQSTSRYNLRRRHVDFAPGDLVWRKNVQLSDATRHFSSSLSPRYVGPFRVKEKIGYGTYVLEGDDNNGRRRWHVKDLKAHVPSASDLAPCST